MSSCVLTTFIKRYDDDDAFVTYVVCLINMRLRNTEHLELSTKMDSKCTHKKDSLHVFWMLRVIYKKNRTEPAVFFSKPNRNRTELEKSIPHIPTGMLDYLHSRRFHGNLEFCGKSSVVRVQLCAYAVSSHCVDMCLMTSHAVNTRLSTVTCRANRTRSTRSTVVNVRPSPCTNTSPAPASACTQLMMMMMMIMMIIMS